MDYRPGLTAALAAMLLSISPAIAATSRETLLLAAYGPSDKPHALALVDSVRAASTTQLARDPHDQEAALDQAMATGYRAKLMRGLGDATAARKAFEALVAVSPRDPEPLLALAGWHLETVHALGGFMAGAMLGAKKAAGLAALDRAVAVGGDRSLVTGLAALLHILVNPGDVAVARRYAEAAVASPSGSPEDLQMKRAAALLLVPLRANDGTAAEALAAKLLPFGRFGRS